MRARAVTVSLVILLTSVACDSSGQPDPKPNVAAAPAPTATVVRDRASVSIAVDLRPPIRSEPIVKGRFRPEVVLTDARGKRVTGSPGEGRRRVTTGRYRIAAGVERCDGDCTALDGVILTCRRALDLSANLTTVIVRLQTDRRCELRIKLSK